MTKLQTVDARISLELLEVLACVSPHHAPLIVEDEFLVCIECRGRYPVVEGVPVLLPSSRINGEQVSWPTELRRRAERRSLARLLSAYRWYCFFSRPTRPIIRRELARHLSSQQPARVLEVGGGTSMMRGTFPPSCHLISTDIAPTANTHVISDAQLLGMRDESFDMQVAFEVMEHIPDTQAFLAELSRSLRPGGFLMLSIPFMYGRHDLADYHRFTPQGLERMLAQHGLQMTRCRKIGGTFLAVSTLIANWMRAPLVRPSAWRADRKATKLKLLVASILTAPLSLLQWAAFAADALVDRESDSPMGLIVFAQKTLKSEPVSSE